MAKISVFTRKNNWFVYKIKSINYTLYKLVFQSVKRRFLPLKIQKPHNIKVFASRQKPLFSRFSQKKWYHARTKPHCGLYPFWYQVPLMLLQKVCEKTLKKTKKCVTVKVKKSRKISQPKLADLLGNARANLRLCRSIRLRQLTSLRIR